ncbi:unnamed protein product [Effrenium voratum]|uniref:Calcineurin-like phosphoesterase domain-containing protein n=1 Tax=Effrenium voratum TaxID=2562239 RepID=A0AA36NCI9_9DINO|nr:unnamed protein product [Effrenium voratum]CAJ1427589.1 unnamed protein product [Effrenium voratum]
MMGVAELRSRLVLAFLCGVSGETLDSLHIHPSSRLAAIFQSAAGSGGQLDDGERAAFAAASEELVAGFWLTAPMEVSLYSASGCGGEEVPVLSSGNESRCSSCFDVCGKTFPSGLALAAPNTGSAGFVSKVKSVRVTKGAASLVPNFCMGTYNFGQVTTGSRVQTAQDGCIDFAEGQAPGHIAAVPAPILELVSGDLLKADRDPFDERLSAQEAEALPTLPASLYTAADSNQDGFLSASEYLQTLMLHEAKREGAKAFMGAAGMQDSAAAALGPGESSLSESQRAELAKNAFSGYEATAADPETGVTPAPQLGPNGQVIVSASSDVADFGDVRDESMVDGFYNPQIESKVSLCVDGMAFDAGLCYDYCSFDYPDAIMNTCMKEHCPDGFYEIVGGVCKKDGWNIETAMKDSYKREGGNLPELCELGGSFGPGSTDDNGNRDFTLAIVSDTQLPWCSGDTKSDTPCAIEENWRLVQGIHKVQDLMWPADGKMVDTPVGVMVTGDLTAYGHTWQYDLYRQIWETRERESADKNIKLPVWPGLGNHDYANNLESGWFAKQEPLWTAYGSNGNAQRMVAYIRSAVGKCDGKTVVPGFGGMVDHYDKDSAAYSAKLGRIRFVHLHNYPTYRRESLVGLSSTMKFLKDEVAEAERTQDYLVLMIHDVGGHFSHTKDKERYDYFSEVTAGSRLLAVFAGHWHTAGGHKYGNLKDSLTGADLLNSWGGEVPILRGYAPDKAKFLVTRWNLAKCYWRFGTVESTGTPATAQWFSSGDEKEHNTFDIPNCTVDSDYVAPDNFFGMISFTISTHPVWALLVVLVQMALA